MSLLLMFITYKKSLFFRGSTSSAYGYNLLFLSDVLLMIVKKYQPLNPWYILMMEVPHRFTLACNQRRGINHSISLLLRVRQFSPWLKVNFIFLYVILLVNIYMSMEVKYVFFFVKHSIYVQEK